MIMVNLLLSVNPYQHSRGRGGGQRQQKTDGAFGDAGPIGNSLVIFCRYILGVRQFRIVSMHQGSEEYLDTLLPADGGKAQDAQGSILNCGPELNAGALNFDFGAYILYSIHIPNQLKVNFLAWLQRAERGADGLESVGGSTSMTNM